MTTAEHAVDVLLSDGSTVQLRPIDPSDAPEIVAMHSRFSERTRYLRYFSPYPRIPERDLHRFVNVDHRDREAFVVLAGDRIVAVGRYERLGPAAPDAEVAFVVEDAYQGRGIGSVLMEHLADAARRAGIVNFVAEVLPANGQMLRVFADFGYQIQREFADGVVHLSFPIAPTEATLEVQRGREHRTEARSIARLLAPRGVAVYGASATGQGVGAAVLGHLRDGGFTGSVVPVHPSAAGRAGIFSQSGAFGVALLAEADRRGLGLSSFVSAGNRADVSGNDLLQYWQDDAGTDVIMLYLETFGNPRKFARLARRIGRDKPVVALASPARPPGVVTPPARTPRPSARRPRVSPSPTVTRVTWGRGRARPSSPRRWPVPPPTIRSGAGRSPRTRSGCAGRPAPCRSCPGDTDVAALLAAYGIEVVESVPAASVDEAVEAATRLGFPVALKAAAPGLRHD